MSTPAVQFTADPRLPEPESSRWRLLRAGLQNIWEYDDQRFIFHRGRLLLRGQNESGKTKALEVLLPFLLDADLSPQRLDPFGSTSRPMRWNLINEANPDVNISVGYVWLEFGRREGEHPEYKTIGAGLRARRTGTGVEVWYFVMSQRIDVDLSILQKHRIPLVATRLAEAIGDAGEVFERQSGYRKAVNRELFGMPPEQYSALVDALLQLRRPQLSKQLQPAELSRILTASLPPLDRRVLAPLAEGFERLDRHRDEREALRQTLDTVTAFTNVYQDYLRVVAKAHAQQVTKADSAYQRARAKLRDKRNEHEQALELQAQLASALLVLRNEEDGLAERIATLRGSDEYRAAQEVDQAEQMVSIKREAAEQSQVRLRRETEDLQELQRVRQQAEEHVAKQMAALGPIQHRAGQTAAAADFLSQHKSLERAIDEEQLESARGTLESLLTTRDKAISELDVEVEQVREARQLHELALDRRREAEESVRQAEEAVAKCQRDESNALETYLNDVQVWLDSLEALSLDSKGQASLLDSDDADMSPLARQLVGTRRDNLDEGLSEVRMQLRDVRNELAAATKERDELEASSHRPPAPPHWRAERLSDRPGAPLYLLCDFLGDNEREQANIEAALGASGLLDAWVTPDGQLLDQDTFDVLLIPDPKAGPTLANVLTPTPLHDVTAMAIKPILQSVALWTANDEPPLELGGFWIATNGKWRLGPLRGTLRKDVAQYVGRAARERERAHCLEALTRNVVDLAARRTELQQRNAQIEHSKALLEEELSRFPSRDPVINARAIVASTMLTLTTQRETLQEKSTEEGEAQRRLEEHVAARDAIAATTGLTHWIDRLTELREGTYEYHLATSELIQHATQHLLLRGQLEECAVRADRAGLYVGELTQEARGAEREVQRATVRVEALREAVGSTRDELLTALHVAEERQKSVRLELQRNNDEKSAADQLVGEVSGAAKQADDDVRAEDSRRADEGEQFRRFSTRGLFEILAIELEGAPAGWTLTDTLRAARQVDAAVNRSDCSQAAQDKAANRVVGMQQELLRSLPPEIRILPKQEAGVFEYEATYNGHRRHLRELIVDLETEIASRDRLLGGEELKLFESFLSGETHEHLRTRLREAYDLVERMNGQLKKRPTPRGTELRLSWSVAEDAPSGTNQAIDLLLRSGHLLSDTDRSALTRFLEQRLNEARASDSQGTLQERMLSILDYRTWFSFLVEFRSGTTNWKRLTKKAHGAGSGGQKAVLLHLPLFAAAAAFYESAQATSPRLIVLDEAFAGIDRETRGLLMGLLVEFELDFVMTSYDEYGFYEQLDGLATYNLSRERGMRGVYTDWFLWDGKQATEMGEG